MQPESTPVRKPDGGGSDWIGATLAVSCFAVLAPSLPAQSWTSVPGGAIYYSGGNVGIGITSPAAPLHVIMPSGGWGSFFDAPGNPLVAVRDTNVGAILGLGVAAGYGSWLNGTSPKDAVVLSSGGGLAIGTAVNVRMYLNTAGNVGIGTTAPQYKLAVNGTIGAKEVIVTNTGWADYVFEPGYRLRPLTEVAAYIRGNHRLPGVPSEAEVKARGVGVGEMQVKLLAKIEELTLHMIAAEERNERLERQNRALQERVGRLEAGGGGN